jgi:hypothetical protein
MQDFWSYKQHPSMDASARETSAAAAAMSLPMNPEDEPVADNDETDPFAGSGDEASSEEYAENPGKAMAKHVISKGEEEVVDSADESGGEMAVDSDDAAEPAAASTPSRYSKETFRIVTIEPPTVMHSGLESGQVSRTNAADVNSGDVNSEAAATAASAAKDFVSGTDSDANSASRKKGEGFSTKTVPQMSDDRSQSDAGSAKTNAAGKCDGKENFKIPSMCPRPTKPADKQAAEADAVPSFSYKAILNCWGRAPTTTCGGLFNHSLQEKTGADQ